MLKLSADWFKTHNFSSRHRMAAQRGLDAARIQSGIGCGLFSATIFDASKCRTEVTQGDSVANDENYALAWVRDTLKCSVYDLVAGYPDRVQQTLQTLLAYFHQHQAVMHRAIAYQSQGNALSHLDHAIWPRLHPLTLEPVHADQQKDLQLDMAEILKHLAWAIAHQIPVLTTQADITLVQTLIQYFLAWDYGCNGEIPGDFGIWEEGIGGTDGAAVPDLHASSIAAMLAGYLWIQDTKLVAEDGSQATVAIAPNILSEGFQRLNQHLNAVGETAERPYDLTHFIILLDDQILHQQRGQRLLTDENQQRLFKNVTQLERSRGFLRYGSDKNLNSLDEYHKWGSPTGQSAEWTLGLAYAVLVYALQEQYDQAQRYLDQLESVFDWQTELGLPEAYFGGTDQPVPISPLSWANALYLTIYAAST